MASSLSSSLSPYILSANSPNWPLLAHNPNKLLMYYIRLKRQPLSVNTLEAKVQLSTQRECFEFLLQCYEKGSLSSYHFVKLVCHCPEKAEGYKDSFQKELINFDKELVENEQEKNWRRAEKISIWIQGNPIQQGLLPSKGYLDQKIIDKSGNEHVVNRYQWMKHVPLIRHQLPFFEESESIILNEVGSEELTIVDQICKGNYIDFHTFEYEKLLSLHNVADFLGMEDLCKKCARALEKHIKNETLFPLLLFSLENKYQNLIQLCCDQTKLMPDIRLDWNKNQEMTLELSNLNDTSRTFLETFNFFVNCLKLTNSTVVEQLIQKKWEFQNLNTLILDTDINSTMMQKLAERFPKTKKLTLQEKNYEKIVNELEGRVLENWRYLEVLHLKDSKSSLWRNIFPHLKLCLKDTMDDRPIYNNQDRVLVFAGNLQPLTDINLFRHGKIVCDIVVLELVKACPNLTGLNLCGCKQVTGASVLKLTQKCPKLEDLDLKGCMQVTDASLMELADRCPNLTKLCLDGCTQVTDEFVSTLAESQDLEYLGLRDCTQVTDTSVLKLIEENEYLELDIRGCMGVTAEAIDQIIRLDCCNLLV
ncbi:MAG: hypothetical protein K940chlam7_01731 [Chlamydiae bacterium]|nr:hypothetical protein [Chlamydiota bacterium]